MRTRPAIPNQTARIILAALIAAIAPSLAHAEDIVLPYTCQMSGGRPSLIPSQPHPHRIAGQREERRVTICSPADPGRCRAWTAHRFDMLCSGVEVPWAAVVANSPPARGGAAWIENGRFRLSMPPAWALPTENPCSRLIDDRDPGLARYCANQPLPTERAYAEMPPGFAPMFGLNGTFTTGTLGPAEIASNATRPVPLPPATTPGGNLNWRTSPVAPPQPDSSTATALPPPAVKKKSSLLPPVEARPDPALKPGFPASRDDGISDPTSKQNPVITQQPRTNERPSAPTAAPLDPVKPAIKTEVPKIEPVKPDPIKPELTKPEPAKIETTRPVALPPVTSPAPTSPPVAAAAPAAAPTPAPQPSAAPQPSERSQAAASRSTPEPYSSRPVKLSNPDQDLRTGLTIAAGVALTLTLAAAVIMWRRRRADTDAGEPATPAHSYANHTFDPPALNPPLAGAGGFRDGHRDSNRLPSLDNAPSHLHQPANSPEARSQDPFDRPVPAFAGTFNDTQQSPAGSRSSTGHTLSMTRYDDARTHLDADLPFEDAPVVELEPDPMFETLHAEPAQTALALAPQPARAASVNPGGGQWATDMIPQTRDDALHILGMGVTSRASLTAMKKIVDGLRLSWHPDQATDDADRAIRELRIRQINSAWDLISGHAQINDDPAI